jgi:endonuclease YncB( thermonuclease family)
MRLAGFLWLAGALLHAAAAETLTGRVVGVSDGDTITVLAPGKRAVSACRGVINRKVTGAALGLKGEPEEDRRAGRP